MINRAAIESFNAEPSQSFANITPDGDDTVKILAFELNMSLSHKLISS
jgi:hypothetical protein